MSSFLQKLKKQNVGLPVEDDAAPAQSLKVETGVNPVSELADAEQLKVDVFHTNSAVVVYAKIAGASIHDFTVLIGGDDDIVTVKGQSIRPSGDLFGSKEKGEPQQLVRECCWGRFYRQIILPDEVDAAKAQAKLKDGILVLLLPLKRSTGEGVRVNVVEV